MSQSATPPSSPSASRGTPPPAPAGTENGS
ncbi:TetR family transcriptional regulator, partial [Streptomyces sp. SID11233]|nr:TetR family transcriptional regulator [Streptomyces sp. SID11233]